MRILFLHAALNTFTAEYKVHTTLATNVEKGMLDPYFIWQSPAIRLDQIKPDHIISHDFGRDMSIMPKPNRYRRFGMMIQRLPKTLAFLFSKVREIKPDLIYTSQQDYDVRLASLVSRYFHIPYVLHIHYNVGPWLGKYTLRTIQKSPRLIAVSEFIRQSALLNGATPSSVHTIVNPVPVYQAQQHADRHAIRAEFHFEDDTPLVLAVGRLDPMKGHLPLFEAFASVIQHMPTARLLVCGTSTSRDNFEATLRQRVSELKLDPYVVFAGQRQDIQAIMQSADAFCLPTELDPCPLVFLEAMAEGLPVVAYHSGGVPEMVIHNQTGLLSYPSDSPTLAANLLRVLSNPELALQLGQAGKQRVAEEFTPSKVADRWLNVLQRITPPHS